LSCLQQ